MQARSSLSRDIDDSGVICSQQWRQDDEFQALSDSGFLKPIWAPENCADQAQG